MTNIESIGHIAGQIQTRVSRIKSIARGLGIDPSYHIDGVPHYIEADAQRIAEHVRRQVQQIDGGLGDRSSIH